MRTITFAFALGLFALTTTPVAVADHCCGPCTHEWFDMVLVVPQDHEEGGFRQALGNAGWRAGGCIDDATRGLCEIVACELAAISLP